MATLVIIENDLSDCARMRVTRLLTRARKRSKERQRALFLTAKQINKT
jgi:hypothetical protein